MEKFLLIFCAVLSPTIIQGLLAKRKGTDILVKNVIDKLVQQQGNEDPKRNIYTAISEEINNVDDKGGIDVFINGIQAFIIAKRLVHAGLGIMKRSTSSDNMGDIHARGTSTTPKPAATTTPPETIPPTKASATTLITTITEASITLKPKIESPQFKACRKFWMTCRRASGKIHSIRGWPFKKYL